MIRNSRRRSGLSLESIILTKTIHLMLMRSSKKFKKLMQQEEGSRPMLEFLVNPECTRVFLSEGGKNEFVCFETPPANQKKKIVYFLKLQKVALSAENVAGVVVHGDLAPGVLQHLFETTSEIYLPLLSNHHNQQGLPEVVVKDVMEYYHRLVAAIYVTSAQDCGDASPARAPGERFASLCARSRPLEGRDAVATAAARATLGRPRLEG